VKKGFLNLEEYFPNIKLPKESPDIKAIRVATIEGVVTPKIKCNFLSHII